MSKLEELIQELCPEGVEYKRLGELCNTITTGKLNANAMVENGEYPFYTCDATPFRIDTYAFDEEAILISGNGSQVGHVNYYKGKFNAYQRTYVLYDFKEINVKYLLHYLKGYLRNYIIVHSKKGSIPYITLPMLKEFKFPVPPLKVQCEIVRILDKFTLLTAELTARRKQYEYYRKYLLETESDIIKKMEKLLLKTEVDEEELIKMRKKQYEYYRDGLFKTLKQKKLNNNLSKDDEINEADLEKVVQELYSNGIEYQKIEKFTSFEQPTKYIVKSTKYDNSYEIPVLTAGQTFVLGYTNEKEGIYNTSKEKPVIIFDDFTGAFKWVDFPFKVKSSAMKIIKTQEDKVLLRFLYYKMGVLNFTSTEHKRLWISKYSQISISIPPLEVQNKIVDVLDRFDKLCNGISDGLPAEIDRRQKQYEYYRDLLLNFKEVEGDE